MRRPHRTIETFDISLMAVVTKAMGAFLVLMLLLLPYYTPDSTEDDAAELLRQLQLLDAKLDEVHQQLGDPSKTVEELRQELDEITGTSALRAEVLAKLRGLINKAFSEIRRLESEVAALKEENTALSAKIDELEAIIDPLKAEIARLEEENARLLAEIEPLKAENERLRQENAALVEENARLEAEVAALLERIALLEAELARLQENQPQKKFRAVIASYDARNCNDVTLSGHILEVGKEEGYTFTDDNSEMGLDYLFQGNFGMRGGAVPRQDPMADADSAVGIRSSLPNAGMLTDMNIGQGEHVVVLVKKDRQKSYEVDGRNWRLLKPSNRACNTGIEAAARAAFVDDWGAGTSLLWTFRAKAIAGIPIAFTSDDKGIQFRVPTEEEEAWIDKLLKLALEAQDEIPEIKKEREEAERKAREAEEKRRREAEERRKREEEERKSAPTASHFRPQDLDRMRLMLSRYEAVPKQSPMRRRMEGMLEVGRRKIELQIEETTNQLKTLPFGPKRDRTEMFLADLKKLASELGGPEDEKEEEKSDDEGPVEESAGDDLATSHIRPNDLRQLGTMERMYKRAPEDSAMRKSLEKRLMDLRRRVKLQIEETTKQVEALPPGPKRERAEKFLQDLRKHESMP